MRKEYHKGQMKVSLWDQKPTRTTTMKANIGHATAAFTLDVYGHVADHVADEMRKNSSGRMEDYI